MKAPLLSKHRAPYFPRCILFTFLFVFFVFTLFLHFDMYTLSHKNVEESIGGFHPRFFDVHFLMSPMPDNVWNGKHFLGRQTKVLTPFNAHCNLLTPSCEDICRQKMKNEQPSSRVCINIYRIPQQCWSTEDIRCWGWDNLVWDGTVEWLVLGEDQTGSEIGVRWIHFIWNIPLVPGAESDFHLFSFGDGKIETFNVIKEKLGKATNLHSHLNMVEDNDNVMFTGHHMGAAWAAQLNIWFGQQGKPGDKRTAIGSSPPLASKSFHRSYMEQSNTSKMLLLGLQVGGKLVMDVKMVQMPDVVTDVDTQSLPQFAYACDINESGMTCMDPQPLAFSRFVTFQQASQGAIEQHILDKASEIETYMTCFHACSHRFDWMNADFVENVSPFDFRPIPHMQLLQPGQPNAGPFPLPLPPSSSQDPTYLQSNPVVTMKNYDLLQLEQLQAGLSGIGPPVILPASSSQAGPSQLDPVTYPIQGGTEQLPSDLDPSELESGLEMLQSYMIPSNTQPQSSINSDTLTQATAPFVGATPVVARRAPASPSDSMAPVFAYPPPPPLQSYSMAASSSTDSVSHFAAPRAHNEGQVFASELPPEALQSLQAQSASDYPRAKVRPTAEDVMRTMNPRRGEGIAAYRRRIINEVRTRFQLTKQKYSGDWHTRQWFVDESKTIWDDFQKYFRENPGI